MEDPFLTAALSVVASAITSLLTIGLTEKRRINIEARQNLAVEISLQVQKEIDYRIATIAAFESGARKPKGTQNRNLSEAVQYFDYREFSARLLFLSKNPLIAAFEEWLKTLNAATDEELFRNAQLAVESNGRLELEPQLEKLRTNLFDLQIASDKLIGKLKKDVNPRWA